jgi:hypothetical protein
MNHFTYKVFNWTLFQDEDSEEFRKSPTIVKDSLHRERLWWILSCTKFRWLSRKKMPEVPDANLRDLKWLRQRKKSWAEWTQGVWRENKTRTTIGHIEYRMLSARSPRAQSQQSKWDEGNVIMQKEFEGTLEWKMKSGNESLKCVAVKYLLWALLGTCVKGLPIW